MLLRWKRRNESSTPSWVWEYAWWEECHTVCKWLKFMGENFLYSKPTCYFLTSFSAFYTFNQATFKVFSWLHKILNFKITLRIFQSLLNYFFKPSRNLIFFLNTCKRQNMFTSMLEIWYFSKKQKHFSYKISRAAFPPRKHKIFKFFAQNCLFFTIVV